MRRRAAVVTVLLAIACNEVLGLDPGTLRPEEGRGGTFSVAHGGDGNATGGPGSGRAGDGGNGAEGGEGEGGDGSGEASCTTTADCQELGLDSPRHLCLAGACVDVLTKECDTVLGAEWLSEHPADQPIVLGAIAENVDERSPSYWSLELATREFAAHGPVPIDGAPQRPVLLVCRVAAPDPFSGPTQRSLDHLLDDVGVSGMVMLQSRPELLESIQYAVGKKRADAFFIDVGGGTADLLGRNVDGGRLWHMSGDASSISSLYYPLVRLVEEHLNPGASSGSGARLTRVVLVPPSEEDGFESALAGAVEGSVFINDRLMVENPDTYRMVIARNRPFAAADEVAAFGPDIVIDFAGLYVYLERLVRQEGATPPFYILPPSQSHSPVLREQLALDTTLQARLLGVSHAGPDDVHKPLYDAYLERYASIAPAGVDGSGSANVYEAAYFLTYAAIAGGTGGSNMNRGMTRLLGLLTADRRDIGPTAIASVIELLGSAPTLSLHGALGPPSFNPNSGGRTVPASVWCVDKNQRFVSDVLRFDETRGLVGTFSCFDL
jgi:hypothetical protein